MPDLCSAASDRLLTQRAREWLNRNQNFTSTDWPSTREDTVTGVELGGNEGFNVFNTHRHFGDLTLGAQQGSGSRPTSASGRLPLQRSHSSRLLSKVQMMGLDSRTGQNNEMGMLRIFIVMLPLSSLSPSLLPFLLYSCPTGPLRHYLPALYICLCIFVSSF